jgi:hypothetical protein
VPDLAEQTVVVPLDVPADAGPSVAVGRASAYEYGGSLGMLRVVSISEQPGDTSEGTALLVSGGMTVASINFATQAAAGAVLVQPGRRYYFNLRNLNPEPGVVYPAAVEINWPR